MSKLPKLSVDPQQPGVIRIQGCDALTGILAGVRAPEIVQQCNAYDGLAFALKQISELAPGSSGAYRKFSHAQNLARRALRDAGIT
jgi:hypothetical protein